jgi:hypothetical protein
MRSARLATSPPRARPRQPCSRPVPRTHLVPPAVRTLSFDCPSAPARVGLPPAAYPAMLPMRLCLGLPPISVSLATPLAAAPNSFRPWQTESCRSQAPPEPERLPILLLCPVSLEAPAQIRHRSPRRRMRRLEEQLVQYWPRRSRWRRAILDSCRRRTIRRVPGLLAIFGPSRIIARTAARRPSTGQDKPGQTRRPAQSA